jgi:hypothetical protein
MDRAAIIFFKHRATWMDMWVMSKWLFTSKPLRHLKLKLKLHPLRARGLLPSSRASSVRLMGRANPQELITTLLWVYFCQRWRRSYTNRSALYNLTRCIYIAVAYDDLRFGRPLLVHPWIIVTSAYLARIKAQILISDWSTRCVGRT